MSPASIAVVILLAILVGAAVPVLIQLRNTLKTLQTFLQQTGKRLDEALDEITEAAERVTKLGKELEEGASRMRFLFDVAGDLGSSLAKLRDGVNTATLAANAVGPAVLAAVKSFFKRDDEPARDVATEAPANPHQGEAQETRS